MFSHAPPDIAHRWRRRWRGVLKREKKLGGGQQTNEIEVN